MASLKDVRVKISGVGKTKQITKAMNMVASAKLRGAQSRIEQFRTYADRFKTMLHDIAAGEEDSTHPLLEQREEVNGVAIVLATSDRGLCGGFNANLINAALKLAAAKKTEGKSVVFYCIGRKGREAARKAGMPIAGDFSGYGNAIDFQLADRLGLEIITAFLDKKVDEVFLVYGEFVNMMRQLPVTTQVLPLRAGDGDTKEKSDKKAEQAPAQGVEYLCEPTGRALMEALLPRVIKSQVYRGLLDTSASEHAARMTAMDNATRNCDDLIGSLTRLFNKTRQAAITKDLIDIVGGVEALKG